MKDSQKRFIVPREVAHKAVLEVSHLMNTVNRRKFGRSRRGTVLLTGCNGKELENGRWEVNLRFTSGGTAYFRVAGAGRWQVYQFSDYRKLLRRLALSDSSSNT